MTEEKPAPLDATTPRSVLRDYLRNRPDKVYEKISPSQLGKCHRSHYFKIKGYRPTMTPTDAALSNFEVGFLWEEIMLKALIDQKVPHEYQTRFDDPELNMGGTSDFIIGDKTVESIMWDTKTVMSKWFWYRKKTQSYPNYDWFTENYVYVIQQAAYLLMAERLGFKIKKSVLAFISKDDGFIGDELEVRLTDKVRKEVMKRIKELNYYLTNDIVPPCTCDGWLVGYCDFGNPNTTQANKTKKIVATECCPEPEVLEAWREQYINKKSQGLSVA